MARRRAAPSRTTATRCVSLECAFMSHLHCEEQSDESIQCFTCCPGLLRGACHRAGVRPTRWLAMTNLSNRLARIRHRGGEATVDGDGLAVDVRCFVARQK